MKPEVGRSRHVVLHDGYDLDQLEAALGGEPGLQQAVEKVSRLLPNGRELVGDLFFSLFKLNVVVQPPESVIASSLVNRRLVMAVVTSPKLEELRQRTALDGSESAAAAALLAGRLVRALTRDYRVLERELIDLAEIALDEARLEELERQREYLERIAESGEAAGEEAETVSRLRRSLEGDIDALEGELRRARSRQERLAEGIPLQLESEITFEIGRLSGQLDSLDEQLESLGLGRGADGKVSARTRLELGQKLLASRKLQLLARLVGAMKEVAFEARRHRVVRAPQEAHQVRTGGDLERLLPSELLGLPPERGALHLDFLKRFIEGELLQYQLRGAAERGPMVICVDGSGSMQGSKELWAKAVALTLMEIARREKRRCLAIVFSSGSELLEVELLGASAGQGRRALVQDDQVLRFAEHFPGGGTSFEEPLRRAVEAVSQGAYRRGDIVFISDGQAPVSDELVARIEEARARYRFQIRGIEVDLQQSTSEGMERFCDQVRKVTDLTADSMADLFASL